MSMDMTYFDEMEARIPRGKVRTRFAQLSDSVPHEVKYISSGSAPSAFATLALAVSSASLACLPIE